MGPESKDPKDPNHGCRLFSITQFECSPADGRVTCWPLERIFRQCGKHAPAIEVTSQIEPSVTDSSKPVVPPDVLDNMPRGKSWSDVAVGFGR